MNLEKEEYIKILEKATEDIDILNDEVDKLKKENDILKQKLNIIKQLSGQTNIYADLNSPLPPPMKLDIGNKI